MRIKFGSNGWLMFRVTGSPATPELYLDNTVTEEEATVFSWGYLKKEYYLYQKNDLHHDYLIGHLPHKLHYRVIVNTTGYKKETTVDYIITVTDVTGNKLHLFLQSN